MKDHADTLRPYMRITNQRQVIVEELRKVKTHPTANDLFEMVRKRLPRIGLGTVYRNLEVLADAGVILKISSGGLQKRFDGTAAPHYHIRCELCGAVDDIDMPCVQNIEKKAAQITHYTITSHHIEFRGQCPSCQGRGNVRHPA